MQNNLTKKEIDNLCKWAKECQIKDLDSEEKILNIKELEIDYLPNEIFKLTNLESLHIAYDNLKEIPKDIGKLINLKSLDICSCDVKTFPKEMFDLV